MQLDPNIDPALQGKHLADNEPGLMEIEGLGVGTSSSFSQASILSPKPLSINEPASNAPIQRDYKELKVPDLKKALKSRGLKISNGVKETLRLRLVDDDIKRSARPHSVHSETPPLPSPPTPLQSNTESDLLFSFQHAVDGRLGDQDFEGEEDSDSDDVACPEPLSPPEIIDKINAALATSSNIQWVDEYIFEARRKGGKNTEKSVLGQWRLWLVDAIQQRVVPDAVVDANHIMQYLKYAATRQLFTRNGKTTDSDARLSSNSLRKITVMLGRVRRRQVDKEPSLDETRPATSNRLQDFSKAVMMQANRLRLERPDFDVTKGTLLEYELRPEQLDEIVLAITQMNQINSIVKGLFSWNWQASTLIRGDELVNLWLSCLQPYEMAIPDTKFASGCITASNRRVWGILSMYFDGKTSRTDRKEPNYNMVIPHREPLRCSIAATALLLHFLFDREAIVSKVPGWDWAQASTWRAYRVLFGKKVTDPLTTDGLNRMYRKMLDGTTISHSKKTHLCRKAVPTIIEDMGVTADQVDAIGHWEGNTRREVYASKIPKMAVLALAGFGVGETYAVPWTEVDIPDDLCNRIFPFAETALAQLRMVGCENQGSINFLQLLTQLRPFFWRLIAVIFVQFPECSLLKRLDVIQCEEAQTFLRKWPALLLKAQQEHEQVLDLSHTFTELPTQNAFISLSTSLRNLEDKVQRDMAVLHRRTVQFSPSKKRQASHQWTSEQPEKRSRQCNTASPVPILLPPEPPLPSPSPNYLPPTPPATLFTSSPSTQNSIPLPVTNPIPPPSSTDPHQNTILTVVTHKVNDSIFYILPLTPSLPGMPPLRTPFDLILPSPTAFMPATDSESTASFPLFDTSACSWGYVLDHVRRPDLLWDIYGPLSLGSYSTVKDLWKAWDEGSRIDGVGCKPALRLIDQKWGIRMNEMTRKGHQAQWRPSNNTTARKKWSNFYFFVRHVLKLVSEGRSPDNAIEHLESVRGTDSMPKLMLRLQEPRKKKGPPVQAEE